MYTVSQYEKRPSYMANHCSRLLDESMFYLSQPSHNFDCLKPISVRLSICISVSPSVHPSIHPSVRPSVCPSVGPFVQVHTWPACLNNVAALIVEYRGLNTHTYLLADGHPLPGSLVFTTLPDPQFNISTRTMVII